jgi:excinuclease ABC subunit C
LQNAHGNVLGHGLKKFTSSNFFTARPLLTAPAPGLIYGLPMDDQHAPTPRSRPATPLSRDVLADVPATPGVYLFKDAGGRVVYVGKAKHLRKRVASYFRNPAEQTPKTRAMLAQAAALDTLCTSSEKEALLLEASLIKKHRPRYNIVLRDDKQYVLFRLDKASQWPRLTLTRRVVRDGSVYYGPFTSARAARQTWKAIHAVFPLRRCNDRAFKNRVRPCLYHHIGLCPAPCVLEVDPQEYGAMVRRVEMLLAGRSGELAEVLRKEMLAASEAMEFERAAALRDQIDSVKRTVEQQAAVLPDEQDVDVVGLAQTPDGLALGLLFVRRGRLLDRKHFFWPGLDLEDGPEALGSFLGQFYDARRFIPARVLIPWDMADQGRRESLEELLAELRGGAVRIAPPRTGTEKRLCAMAATNAREAAALRTGTDSLPALLARRLRLPAEPGRIECVDVSHSSGRETRAGMVVYEDGRPAKDQYRVYAFPDQEAADDYAVLAAWAARRAAAGPPWPDLLLVDGGKGQLAAVQRGLDEAGAAGLFPVAGLAKARDQEGRTLRSKANVEDRVFLPGRKNPLDLKPGSPELLFLQRVRDTAHDYVIGRHRQARRKALMRGELERIPGVGPKTARLLWQRFDSLQAMADAGPEGLERVEGLGRKRARAVHAALTELLS